MDQHTKCWAYVYYLMWPTQGQFCNGPKVEMRPQESEVDGIYWWDEEQITHGLEDGTIPSDG